MLVDARVLDEDEHPPMELVVHRNAEKNTIAEALRPVVDGRNPEHLFLYGPSGVGKTTFARVATERLREETLGVRTGYINCWKDHSRYKVLFTAVEQLTNYAAIHRHSTPRDELIDILLEELDGPAILILDEADQLDDYNTLYDLHMVPRLSLILVANRDIELLAELDDRVRSRIQTAHQVPFDRYGDDQIFGILEKRTEYGLVDGAVSTSLLKYVARAAEGDARRAIAILRVAVDIAESRGYERLTEEIVGDAIPEARKEVRQKNLSMLTKHQRVLYEVLEEESRNQTNLYEEYCNRVDDAVTRRTVRSHLQKMEQYHLLTHERKGREKIYRVIEKPMTDRGSLRAAQFVE